MEKVILFILLRSFQIAPSQVTDSTMYKSAQELFDYHNSNYLAINITIPF